MAAEIYRDFIPSACHRDPPRSPVVLLDLFISNSTFFPASPPWCTPFLDSCLSSARNAHRESPLLPAMLASPTFHYVLRMFPHLIAESLRSHEAALEAARSSYPQHARHVIIHAALCA
jgi:hypothetical protein